MLNKPKKVEIWDKFCTFAKVSENDQKNKMSNLEKVIDILRSKLDSWELKPLKDKKVLSLYMDDGRVKWKLEENTVNVFKSREEGLEYIKEYFSNLKSYTRMDIHYAKKFRVELDREKVAACYQEEIEDVEHTERLETIKKLML